MASQTSSFTYTVKPSYDQILQENLERTQKIYTFSHTWFLGTELRKRIFEFLRPNTLLHILEIGSYEGISACFFSDELLTHPDSKLVCVDPFDMHDEHTTLTSETETRFLNNIRQSRNYDKVRLYRMTSDHYFTNIIEKDASFDFVYIDGSHVPEQVVRDIHHAFSYTRISGIIWLDDYRGNMDICNAINGCLNTIYDRIEIIHQGYQLAFRKLS